MKHPEKLFSDEDQKQIAEAVKKAELSTSGEIVPFVVGQSDQYPEASLRLGALFAFISMFVFAVLDIGTDIWLPFGISETAIITVLAFGLGMLLVYLFPRVKRMIILSSAVDQRVDERASMAFLSEEVFDTRERTGIMLFLSLFEHRVRVMGDSGVNSKVEQKEWDDIVTIITDGMKAGTPAAGLIKAIEKCGTLLEGFGVEIRDDDMNELDNSLRMSEK
jgi:putative membrane protein